jgi:hypothetical protein
MSEEIVTPGLFPKSGMGWWRQGLLYQIPPELLYRLDRAGIGKQQAAAIGYVFKHQGRRPKDEIERCPHCGEVTRYRRVISERAEAIVRDYLDELQQGKGGEHRRNL